MVCITHMFIEVYLLTQVALIPIFINEFQLSILEASLVASIPGSTQLLLWFPIGFLADRFNTKFFLIFSMMIEGSAAILLFQTTSFSALVVGVSVMRISIPIYHTSGLSLISKFDSRDLNRSMGFHNTLGNIGSAMGVISLSIFLLNVGWRWVYLFWSIPILAWGFFILLSWKDGKKIEISDRYFEKGSKRPSFDLLVLTGLTTFLIVIGFREMGVNGVFTFLTTFLEMERSLPGATATFIFGLGPFMGVFGSLGGGYLGEKIGAKRALSLIILGSAISLLALMFSSHLLMLTLIFLVFAALSNSAYVPMNTIVASITPSTKRGLSFSAYLFTENLVITVTPAILAVIIGVTHIWYIFPFSVILLLASLGVLQFIRYKQEVRVHKVN